MLEERCLLSVYTVTDPSDDGGSGTLRSIIQQVDNDTTPDVIDFDLPGTAPYVIQPTSALPEITNSVTIDGTSQPGYSGQPLVELNGSQAGGGSNGLQLEVGNVTIQGLIIDQFNGNGIQIDQGNDDLIDGNYIGTDSTGTQAEGNNGDGITLGTTSNDTIGGTTAQTRNIISANGAKGIHFIFGTNTGVLVEGNYIGTDVTGTQSLGNNANGIDIFANASDNTIGGTAAGAGNVIANNNGQGIEIFDDASPDNVIEGNFIGTDATGTVAMGNSGWGIETDSSGTLILNNVISDNGAGGVHPQDTGIVIQGNDIGTDVTGTLALGNRGPGIDANSSGVEIGGTGAGQSNVIAFNGSVGPARRHRRERLDGRDHPQQLDLLQRRDRHRPRQQRRDAQSSRRADLGTEQLPELPGARSRSDFRGLDCHHRHAQQRGQLDIHDSVVRQPDGRPDRIRPRKNADRDDIGDDRRAAETRASRRASSTVINAGDAISATATDSTGDTSEFAQDVTVIALTSPLEAVNDSYNTDENTTLTVAAPGVQANDIAANGQPFTSVVESSPAHGTLTLKSDGSFTYVPDGELPRTRFVHVRGRARKRDLERRHGVDLGQSHDTLCHQHQRQRARIAASRRSQLAAASNSAGPGHHPLQDSRHRAVRYRPGLAASGRRACDDHQRLQPARRTHQLPLDRRQRRHRDPD